jgi:Tol biopolymer transport system component
MRAWLSITSLVATFGGAVAFVACVGDETTTVAGSDAGGADVTSQDSSTQDAAGNAGDGAALDSGSTQDAGADADAAPPCDLSKPFGAPTLVPGVSTAYDAFGPRVIGDETVIYFFTDFADAGGPGLYDIYYATRTGRTAAFGALMQPPGINTTGNEVTPFVTDDQLTIFFGANGHPMSAGYDIWVGTRTSTLSSFSGITLISGVMSATQDERPFLRADGQELWFSSDRAGGTGFDIYRAPASGGSFSNPVAVAELNTSVNDDWPYLTRDGLTAFWSSARTDGTAKGGNDIWTASRKSLGDVFSTPVDVLELNTSSNENMGSLSADGCRIYLSSDRGGATTNIFVAERPQ